MNLFGLSFILYFFKLSYGSKTTRDGKGHSDQILNCLDINVILNSKNEISTNVYSKKY